MWLSYHIPCFYILIRVVYVPVSTKISSRAFKGLEKRGVTYIKLETVKEKMSDDFVDEEILSFYTDDKNTHEKLQTFLDIFLMMQLISMSQI